MRRAHTFLIFLIVSLSSYGAPDVPADLEAAFKSCRDRLAALAQLRIRHAQLTRDALWFDVLSENPSDEALIEVNIGVAKPAPQDSAPPTDAATARAKKEADRASQIAAIKPVSAEDIDALLAVVKNAANTHLYVSDLFELLMVSDNLDMKAMELFSDENISRGAVSAAQDGLEILLNHAFDRIYPYPPPPATPPKAVLIGQRDPKFASRFSFYWKNMASQFKKVPHLLFRGLEKKDADEPLTLDEWRRANPVEGLERFQTSEVHLVGAIHSIKILKDVLKFDENNSARITIHVMGSTWKSQNDSLLQEGVKERYQRYRGLNPPSPRYAGTQLDLLFGNVVGIAADARRVYFRELCQELIRNNFGPGYGFASLRRNSGNDRVFEFMQGNKKLTINIEYPTED